MASTRGTRIAGKIKERIVRQKAKYPNVNTNLKVTKESAISLIQPLFRSRVNQFDFDFAINVLEQVSYDEPTTFSVAKAIANNICIGIDNDVNIKSNVSDKINETCRKILTDALTEAGVCERIITNQEILNKRFDVDKLVRENQYRSIGYIVSELCKMIDTYEMPMTAKFNIALENVPYILAKNNIEFDRDVTIADAITEYFLMRDDSISDVDYRAIRSSLLESQTLDIDPNNSTKLLSHVFNNKGSYYLDKMMNIFSKTRNSYLESFVYKLSSITTESDAANYMNQVATIIKENSLSEEDEAKLYYSVDNISNISSISKEFIELQKPLFFDLDRFDTLSNSGCVFANNRGSSEDDYSIFDKKCLVFESNDESSNDIKGLIARFKAEQDKSPNMFKRFLEKLHTKSPESVIDQTASIFTFVRAGVLLTLASTGTVGIIASAVLGLVSWLLSRHLNDKQGTKLLKYIRDEKKTISEKIDNTSDKDKKESLEKYLKSLETAERNVEEYLDSIVDEDHSDNDFDFNFDDIDFESAMINVDNILKDSASIMENMQLYNIDYRPLIKYCAENYMLHDLIDLIKESSIPMKKIKADLKDAYNNSISIQESTAIRYENDNINNHIDRNIYEKIYCEARVNDVINEIIVTPLNESGLTTLKLAIQKGKSMLRDVNTKYQSMWQSVDAHASGLVNGIEKSMTSDRREAIIKGSIIPSLSKCCKSAIALAGVGIFAGTYAAAIGAVGMVAISSKLNKRERQLLMDEIDTELKVVDRQIELAQNEGDMNQYRFLLNYQKKLSREMQRIRYGMKVSGRAIPSATLPNR